MPLDEPAREREALVRMAPESVCLPLQPELAELDIDERVTVAPHVEREQVSTGPGYRHLGVLATGEAADE